MPKQYSYEANELPEDATPAWSLIGTHNESVSKGILTIEKPSGTGGWYELFNADISNITGFTIEAKIKVITSDEVSGYGCILGVEFGAGEPWAYLYLRKDKIMINEGVVAPVEYEMDTTDGFHVYRFIVKDSICKAYVDGVLRLTATINNIQGNDTLAEFGTFDDPFEHQWDYVYFRTDGAFAPTSYLSAKRNMLSGYISYINQYVRNKFANKNPLKLPDGRQW